MILNMTPLETYKLNINLRDWVKLKKAKMNPLEYMLEYRRADRRVQQSKRILRKHNISFE